MIITITGRPGSGKSTVGQLLAKHLGYEYVYAGSMFRKMAEERGIPLEDFYAQAGSDTSLDRMVDEAIAERMQSGDNLVVDGKVAFLWEAPGKKKIKVFLTVEPHEGARRVFAAKRAGERNEERQPVTLLDTARDIEERIATERERYLALYGVDHHNTAYHDIILDTTHRSPEEIAEEILRTIKAAEESP